MANRPGLAERWSLREDRIHAHRRAASILPGTPGGRSMPARGLNWPYQPADGRCAISARAAGGASAKPTGLVPDAGDDRLELFGSQAVGPDEDDLAVVRRRCAGGRNPAYRLDLVRPSRLVVGSVLIAALALVALPGLAGSRVPSSLEPLPASAFQPLSVLANQARSTLSIGPLDAAYDAASAVAIDASFIEPGAAPATGPTGRIKLNQPDLSAAFERKPPRYTLTGEATFYDAGTTAMRLPRGTIVVICGNAGCVERVVSDYGPIKTSRVVDLYRPDFFAICGCASWSGTTKVTVSVY